MNNVPPNIQPTISSKTGIGISQFPTTEPIFEPTKVEPFFPTSLIHSSSDIVPSAHLQTVSPVTDTAEIILPGTLFLPKNAINFEVELDMK